MHMYIKLPPHGLQRATSARPLAGIFGVAMCRPNAALAFWVRRGEEISFTTHTSSHMHTVYRMTHCSRAVVPLEAASHSLTHSLLERLSDCLSFVGLSVAYHPCMPLVASSAYSSFFNRLSTFLALTLILSGSRPYI